MTDTQRPEMPGSASPGSNAPGTMPSHAPSTPTRTPGVRRRAGAGLPGAAPQTPQAGSAAPNATTSLPAAPPTPPPSFDASVVGALSTDRLHRFLRPSEGNALRPALERYLWDFGLVTTLYPVLHFLEVTLRNALYFAIEAHVHRTSVPTGVGAAAAPGHVACWLDTTPSLLRGRGPDVVADAKRKFAEKQSATPGTPKVMTPGHLVAELPFGFWVRLLKGDYANRRERDKLALWPTLAAAVFPNATDTTRNVGALHTRLEALVALRNRMFHHEPISHLPLPSLWGDAVHTIGLINRDVERLARATDVFGPLYKRTAVAFGPVLANTAAAARPAAAGPAPVPGAAPAAPAGGPTVAP